VPPIVGSCQWFFENEIVLEPDSLSFGNDKESLKIKLVKENSAAGKISWVAHSSENWIRVHPITGETEAESVELRVTVDRRLLGTAGVYYGCVDVGYYGGSQKIIVMAANNFSFRKSLHNAVIRIFEQ